MKLYEINKEMEELLNSAVNEDGEISEEMEVLLTDLELQNDVKVLDTCRYIKGLTAEAKALQDEEKKLFARRRILEKQSVRLKDYISLEANGMELKDDNCSISWRKSEKLVLLQDASKIPECFQKVDIKADVAGIKKYLKQGGSGSSFAEIQICQNLQIK